MSRMRQGDGPNLLSSKIDLIPSMKGAMRVKQFCDDLISAPSGLFVSEI